MGAISGTVFSKDADGFALPLDGAEVKLWLGDTAFNNAMVATNGHGPARKGDLLPVGIAATATIAATGATYGGDGAYRFDAVTSGLWWVSIEYGSEPIAWECHDVSNINGNVAIAGTLAVAGATTLSSTLNVTGAVTLASTLGVTGVTTLGTVNATVIQKGGVTITATAAEINVLTGVAAGTASPNKAVVLGATSNLDTLALPVSGLKIGPGVGTAVTATAAQLNILSGAILSTSKTWDCGNLVAGATLTTTVAVAGSAVGDYVLIASNTPAEEVGSVIYHAHVSVAGTVTIAATNANSAAPWDPGNQTLKVLVIKQ